MKLVALLLPFGLAHAGPCRCQSFLNGLTEDSMSKKNTRVCIAQNLACYPLFAENCDAGMDECSPSTAGLPAKCKDKKKSEKCKKKIAKKSGYCEKAKNLKRCKYSCHTIMGKTHDRCIAFDDTACDHCTHSKILAPNGTRIGNGQPGDILEDGTTLQCLPASWYASDVQVACHAQMPGTTFYGTPNSVTCFTGVLDPDTFNGATAENFEDTCTLQGNCGSSFGYCNPKLLGAPVP